MLVLLTTTALAMPRFDGTSRSTILLAEAAWGYASDCTDREAPSTEVVPIVRGPVNGGFAAEAQIGPDGLQQITLGQADAPPVVIFHEVAHAWTGRGPSGLVEGRTAVLADCMARAAGAAVSFDDGRTLHHMAPLVDWTNEPRDRLRRHDTYTAARRWFAALDDALDKGELFPRSSWPSWEAFREDLAGRSAQVDELLEILDLPLVLQVQAMDELV